MTASSQSALRSRLELLFLLPRRLRELGVSLPRLTLAAAFAFAAAILHLVSIALFLPLVRSLVSDADVGLSGRLMVVKPLADALGIAPSSVPLLLVAAILLATIGRLVIGLLTDRRVRSIQTAAASRLEVMMVSEQLRAGSSFYDHHSATRSAKLVTRLPAKVSRGVRVYFDLIVTAATFLLFHATLFVINWQLAAAASVALLVVGIVYVRATVSVERLQSALDDAEVETAARTDDLFGNARLVQQFGTAEWETERLSRRSTEMESLRERLRRAADLLDPIRDVAMVALLLGLAALFSQFQSLFDTGSAASVLVFFILFRRGLSSFSRLLRLPKGWAAFERDQQRTMEALELPRRYEVVSGTRPLETLDGVVAVRDLSFRYGERGKPALDGVSCELPLRGRSWIVGSTGSGKSTLLRLLVREYDCEPGTLLVGGTDIRELSTRSLLDKIVLVDSQDSFFDASLRANITYGHDQVDDRRILDLAERLALDGLLERLDGGLDAPLGESARLISSGERQRLGLLRALLHEPEVLLLDETTAALDATTERQVMAALDDLLANHGRIAVAHRLSSLGSEDHVVVLHQGRLLEQGPCSTLLDRSDGALRRLFVDQGLSGARPAASRQREGA